MFSNEDSSDSDIFVEKVVSKSVITKTSQSDGKQDSKSSSKSKHESSLSIQKPKSSNGSSSHKSDKPKSSSDKVASTGSKLSSSGSAKKSELTNLTVKDESSSSSKPSSSKSLVQHVENHDSKNESETIVKELAQIEKDLKLIESQISNLKRKKNTLIDRQNKLHDDLMMLKSTKLSHKDWSTTDFDWSIRLQEILNNIFKIKEFRHLQLSAMNATLAKEDLILVMPTGGGKSLCYQLPALISEGLTLVISPLISLMEDQVMQLKKLGIPAEMMTSSTKREENTRIRKLIKEGREHEKPKLLYVAPEKLAKNKSFMAFIQKLYQDNGLARIAIDEVHCCSDWGHDFRPDYTFLGVLRDMFSEIPIIGLTATASSKVIADVQKILSIQGCLVLKAPFNRPNLYYEVRIKTSVQIEWLDEIESMLKTEFKNQTGIIYALSIKDTEELGSELRKRGIKARWYHASMQPEDRSRAHSQWISGHVQVIVATTAFGLGIDKPDVRFVIHHSISKSIENYYQESGRAGRDGKPAKCILYYRFADYFRLSTLVFTQQTGLPKLSHMLAYCTEPTKCRRSLVAEHFSDTWDSTDCNSMCDHCHKPKTSEEKDITQHCINAHRFIENALCNEVRLTANMLFDLWYGKGKPALRLKDIPTPKSSRNHMENVVAHLIIKNFIKEDFNYTAYSTTSYLKIDAHGRDLLNAGYRIMMPCPGVNLVKSSTKRASSPSQDRAEVKKSKN